MARHASGRSTFTAVIAGAILAGCSSVPIPPTYSQDELRVMCERHSGWWHPGRLGDGYCEPDSHL